MNRLLRLWTLLLVSLFPLSLRGDTLIHAGRLIDGRTDEVRSEMTIVVRDGRIEKVVDGYLEPGEGDQLIRLTDHTVMPGLMDLHTHLSFEHSRNSYTEKFFMSEAEIALRASLYAKRTLLAGFTTVRDLGDNGRTTLALKKAIENGWIEGPRIYTATKSLATTGGHADPTNGLQGEFQRDAGPLEGVLNGPDEAREAVRQRYKAGAHLIKLTATGGVLSLGSSGDNPQFTDEELEAVVSTARDYNLAVAVHAHGTEGMKRAVIAGVDSIEHGTYMTDEVMQLMKINGTYLVPTLMAGEWVARKAEEPDYFPAVVRPKAATIGPVMQQTFRRAYASGVKIAFGTDSGVSPHGENAREFELMVQGGMSPIEAILAATREAAKLLRVEDELGMIANGMAADLVAVPGDPLENIRLMSEIDFVMKGGQVFKQP